MSHDLNFTFQIGRVSQPPRLKDLGGDAGKVLEFSIAQNSGDKSQFRLVKVWNEYAEALERYLTVGKRVAVVGREQVESWKSKDNGQRSRVVIVANQVQLLDSPKRNGKAGK
jgi:single-strand DNA-binding protein